MRLIDADYLLENHVVPFDVLTHGEDDDPESIELNLVPVGYIKGAPTIDAVPVVHARWEGHHCTNCGAVCPTCKTPNGFVMRIETPYCPYCGAKMDEKEQLFDEGADWRGDHEE